MAKMCKIYLALCFLSGLYMASVADLIPERVLEIVSSKYGPCNPEQHDETRDFTLFDLDVKITESGSVLVTGAFTTKTNVTSPLKATLTLRKSVIFGLMVTIPCFGRGFGSCTIDDVCVYGVPESIECPPPGEEDFPCRCPIEPGKYKMPGIWISDIAKTKWAYLFTGYYEAMITLYQGGTEMTCYKLEFTLE